MWTPNPLLCHAGEDSYAGLTVVQNSGLRTRG